MDMSSPNPVPPWVKIPFKIDEPASATLIRYELMQDEMLYAFQTGELVWVENPKSRRDSFGWGGGQSKWEREKWWSKIIIIAWVVWGWFILRHATFFQEDFY